MGKYDAAPRTSGECLGHPSQDMTGRFPVDALLRRNGFQIQQRCSGQEPVWWKNGDAYPQSQAVRYVPWDDLKDALYLDQLQDEGY